MGAPIILARKLQSALKLYRHGGWPVVAEVAWDQSRAYVAANPFVPRARRARLRALNDLFNRPELPPVHFDGEDLARCRTALLYPYLRRQFFDAIAAVPDRAGLSASETAILADALYRRWDFATLDAALPAWRARWAGSKFALVFAHLARRTALRLGRLGEAAEGLAPEGGGVADCLLRAEIWDAQGKLEQASTAFAAAIHRHPADPTVRLGHAFHLLKRGCLLDGLGSWAIADRVLGIHPLRKRKVQWAGDDLGSRTLLVIFEHGFGDMIQMSRFLRRLREAHPRARVLGFAPRALISLLASSFPELSFVAVEDLDPPFDVYIPLMQLPLLLEVSDLEPRRDYIRLPPATLAPPEQGVARIGICWRGHPRQYELTRSIALERFARLLARPMTEFVVLLNTPTPAETAVLDGLPGLHRPLIADFRDLGALVASCDLVVSVDTAVAHVAAAAGKPLLLLSRPDACWRWGAAGRTSPWYADADVVRHPGDMDWDHVLAEAARRMDERLAASDAIMAVAS